MRLPLLPALDLEQLPDLPPPVPFLLALLVLTFWLAMRIHILRRMQARRGSDDAPAPAWRWLRALAATPWIMPALAVLAVLLAAAVVATFFLA